MTTVTVAYFRQNQAALDSMAGGFSIADTAANIQAADALAAMEPDSHITAIAATDTGVVVPVSGFTSYRAALDKVTGGFTVADVASTLIGQIANLKTDTALAALTFTSGSASTSAAFSTGSAKTLNLGSGTLTLNGSATFPASGRPIRMIGLAGAILATTGQTSIQGLAVFGSMTWENDGTVASSGVDLVLGDNNSQTIFHNQVGGVYKFNSNGGILDGTYVSPIFRSYIHAKFINDGLINIIGSNNTISASYSTTSNQRGRIEIDVGSLEFNSGINDFSATTVFGRGSFFISVGESTIGSDTRIFSSGFGIIGQGPRGLSNTTTLTRDFSYEGNFYTRAGAHIEIRDHTFALSGTGTFEDQDNVNGLDGAGAFIDGDAGSVFDTSGIFSINNIHFIADRWNNFGNISIEFESNIYLGKNAILTNEAGSVLNINDYSSIVSEYAKADSDNLMVNDGGIIVSASSYAYNGFIITPSYVDVDFQTTNTPGSIDIDGEILFFRGSSNSFINQRISGNGVFQLSGGGTSSIGAGTIISTGGWTIAKVGTAVNLDESLTYAGNFSQINQTTLNLGANTLTLSGAAAFNLGPGGAPIVTGTGKLILNGSSTTIGGIALGGGTLLRDNGTVSQTGTVTVGDSTNGAALLTIGAGGVWQIAGDVGIAAGSSGAFVNVGGGYLAKTAGSGTSLVAPGIENLSTTAGTIRAKVGTLELGGTLTGALGLVVNGGATLQLDKAASAGTAASFVGAGGTLVLNDAQDFKGSITGFGAGQKLDLASIGYTSPGTVLTYAGSTLTVAGGGKTASLAIGTGYTATSFHLANDTHGGSLVTYG